MMEPLSILLVDDEKRFLSVTQKRLERRGCRVLTATNAIDALKNLREEDIQVVILDIKIPGMDGLDTLKVIKREHPLVEVIMLTGHATVEAALDALRSGAFDFLMKPAGIEELLGKASEAIDKRRRLEEKIRRAESLIRKISSEQRDSES